MYTDPQLCGLLCFIIESLANSESSTLGYHIHHIYTYRTVSHAYLDDLKIGKIRIHVILIVPCSLHKMTDEIRHHRTFIP